MSFVVRKGDSIDPKYQFFLVGDGEHKGHVHIKEWVVSMLSHPSFHEKDPDVVPYFKKALEIMEAWYDSVDEVPVIIN